MRKNSKPIDKYKFGTALKKRGVNKQNLSVKIGHCRSYICQCVKKERFPDSLIYSLEKEINLKYEEYAPDSKQVKNKEEKDADSVLMALYHELQKTNELIKKVVEYQEGHAQILALTIPSQLDKQFETQETILKKMIGLEEVVYKGTKRAWNE